MNSVSLIGNLATDVDVKELGRDRTVASFVVAVDRPGRDGGADYIRVAAWNRQAEACADLLEKGGSIGINGRLRSRSWQDDDGQRRSAVEVVAHQVEFIVSARRGRSVTRSEAAMV